MLLRSASRSGEPGMSKLFNPGHFENFNDSRGPQCIYYREKYNFIKIIITKQYIGFNMIYDIDCLSKTKKQE